MSVPVEPAHVHGDDAGSREVEVCALLPAGDEPGPGVFDVDDFLEDWEIDITRPMHTDPQATLPRGSLAAGQRQSAFLLDVSSRHAPFEVWPDEDAAVAALVVAHRTSRPGALALPPPEESREHEEVSNVPAPDSWIPQPAELRASGRAWKAPAAGGTLKPAAVSARRQRARRSAGGWLIVALFVALAVSGGIELWPRLSAMAAPEPPVAAPSEVLPPILRVDSPQRGARLEVDGEPRGTLPLSLDDLAPGPHRLRLSADGHRPRERTVELAPGERVELELDLEPLPPRLRIELNPEDASVSLQKRGSSERITRRGPQLLDLERGPWEITASRSGFRTATRQVTLVPGDTTVRITLEPAPRAAEDIYWP